MKDALNTIREALIHAYEESIYVSGWRKYRDALVALNHIASSLASYRSTTETMLGIEIPESEGLLGFVPCLMRAAKDRQKVVPADPKDCECPARKTPMEIIRYMQKRAEELGNLCGEKPGYCHPADQRYYGNSGAANAIFNLANEIGSFIINPMEAEPCPCRAMRERAIAEFIDDHGMTCDCCQHVMIDVTAMQAGEKQHCIAGDPEGEGSGCAWSFHGEVVTKLEAERDQLRAELQIIKNGGGW